MSASESVTSRIYAETNAEAGRVAPAKLRSLVRPGVIALEIATDYLVSSAAVLAAFSCNAMLRGGAQPTLYVGLASGLLLVLLLERQGAYRSEGSPLRIRETERVLRAAAQAVWFLPALSLLLGGSSSWGGGILALLFLPLLLIPQKLMLHVLLRTQSAHGADRVVVYGAGNAARRIVSVLLQSHRLRIQPAALIEENAPSSWNSVVEMGYRRGGSVPVLSGMPSMGLLQAFRCNLLIVVTQNLSAEQITFVEEAAERAGVRIAHLSGAELERQFSAERVDLDGLSLASATEPFGELLRSSVKRCVDLVGSSLLLVLFAPLLVLIAFLVRLDSPGPVLFVQERVGSKGQIFRMYKFRSMYLEAPRYARSPQTSRDPRLTRIGRVLRRISLDELPQLLNILLGDMSLVGPRPEMPFVVQSYTAEQRQRLQIVPGLTGLWQLSADRAFPIHEALEYDLYYMRNRGLFLDLAILIHTLFFAMRGGV